MGHINVRNFTSYQYRGTTTLRYDDEWRHDHGMANGHLCLTGRDTLYPDAPGYTTVRIPTTQKCLCTCSQTWSEKREGKDPTLTDKRE